MNILHASWPQPPTLRICGVVNLSSVAALLETEQLVAGDLWQRVSRDTWSPSHAGRQAANQRAGP